MATKQPKYLYLYLTLACFLAIIAIFIFDGYMGVYDSLTINTGEFPQKIEADQWPEQDRYGMPSGSIARGGKVPFIYEVDNRWFSPYAADIEVSAWHSQQKVADLTAQPISLDAFSRGEVAWELDTAALVPADFPAEQSYDFTVIIKRGEIERRIIIYSSPVSYAPKTIVVPQAVE